MRATARARHSPRAPLRMRADADARAREPFLSRQPDKTRYRSTAHEAQSKRWRRRSLQPSGFGLERADDGVDVLLVVVGMKRYTQAVSPRRSDDAVCRQS